MYKRQTVFAGMRAGDRALWWVLFAMGAIAFGATIVVHAWVGYTSLTHLSPSYVGAALYVIGLVLAWPGSRR